MTDPEALLAAASVEQDVFALCPDYRALLVVVDGITPAPSDASSEELLRAAEVHAAELLEVEPVDQLAHVQAWRTAYRAFGAKPQRTRNSLEALTRRAPGGLPRVNRLTDIYNAVSVLHQLPLGGEDLSRYAGPPRLARASGSEPFDTVADGTDVVEHPEPGEVVWRDDAGVTCRRWNWRQGRRTQLHDGTMTAVHHGRTGPDDRRCAAGRRRRPRRSPHWWYADTHLEQVAAPGRVTPLVTWPLNPAGRHTTGFACPLSWTFGAKVITVERPRDWDPATWGACNMTHAMKEMS